MTRSRYPGLLTTFGLVGVPTAAIGTVLVLVDSIEHGPVLSWLVVVLTALVLPLAVWVMRRTGQDVERAYWISPRRAEATTPASLDYRLVRLRRDLRDALERDDRPDQIYPVVRALAAERLLAHHGIDLDTEPERAAVVLDRRLQDYLARPPQGTEKRSTTRLNAAIEGIERLR